MPRPSLITFSLGALLFAAISVQGAVIANHGDPCGNADTCNNGTCAANVCIDKIDGVKDGVGNSCSASDCCAEGLTCIEALGSMTCLDNAAVTESMSKVTCTGTSGSASGSVDSSSSSGTDMSSTMSSNSSTGVDTSSSSGAASSSGTSSSGVGSNTTSSSTGVDTSSGSSGVIIGSSSSTVNTNSTSSTGTTGGTAGVGSDCDANTCCSGSNVCYAIGKKCGPSIGLQTISCGSGSNVTAWTGSGASCGNTAACSNTAETCVSNKCVDTQGQSTVNGLGNSCSADNCCPNGLACYREANICGPTISTLGTVTCTATGGPSGNQTVGNNPAGVGGNGHNAAGTIAAHPIVAAGLVLTSMAISAFFM